MRDSQSAGRLKLGSPLEQIAIEPGFPISRINLRKSANLRIKNPALSERRLDRAQVSTCR